MLPRRTFSATLLAGLAAPSISRASARVPDDIRAALQGQTRMHAVMIQRGDDVIVAEAPRGPGLDRPANIKSCSKSIVALLLGSAIARREIAGIDARLGDVAPRLIPPGASAGVAGLTMDDLVTMRAGLEGTSGRNYGTWVSSPNWVSYALRRPMIDQPGARMIYSTGTTHVLGAALARASGKTLLALARARLGAPLGFDVPAWTRDPQGFYLGGNEMALTPRAMLRIAVAMRDDGRYEGEQVIPAAWMAASLAPHTRSTFSGLAYGYGWFLSQSGYIIARGYGGQVIAANPQRRLAVAITSDMSGPARSGGYFGELMALLEGPVLALA